MFKKINNISSRNETLIVCFLFIASFVVRTILANYIKVLYTYNDELYYYQIAENIARGNGFPIVYHQHIGFYKILYPLIITPAFWFKERATQAFVVALINSICMSSTIFPVYLLSKKILDKPVSRILVCIFLLVIPDLTLTMTFMSEILYLPITTWLIYGFYLILTEEKEKRYVLSFLIGILAYLCYLCKEISLSLIPAYAVTILVLIIKERKISKEIIIRNLLMLLSFVACYGIFHFLFETEVKSEYSNAISKMINLTGISNGSSNISSIVYILKTFVYYVIAILVSYCFFTIIIPLISYKQLSKNTQKLLLLVLSSLFWTILVVIYLTNLKEDFDRWVPILHFRYITYAWMPLLIIFFKAIETRVQISLKKLIPISMVFALALLYDFKDIFIGSTVDHTLLMSISQIWYLKFHLFKVGFILAIVIGVILFKFKKNIAVYVLTLIALMGIFISDTKFCCTDNYARKSCPDLYYIPVTEVSDFITSHPDSTFMITYCRDEGGQRALDTFCNYDNVYTYRSYNLTGDEYYSYDYVILQNNPYDVEVELDGEIIIHNEWYSVIDMA